MSLESILRLVQDIRLHILHKIGVMLLEDIKHQKLKKMFKIYFGFIKMFFKMKKVDNNSSKTTTDPSNQPIPPIDPSNPDNNSSKTTTDPSNQPIPPIDPSNQPIPPIDPSNQPNSGNNTKTTTDLANLGNYSDSQLDISTQLLRNNVDLVEINNNFDIEIQHFLENNLPLNQMLVSPSFVKDKFLEIIDSSTVTITRYSSNLCNESYQFGLYFPNNKFIIDNSNISNVNNTINLGSFVNVKLGFFVIFNNTLTFDTDYTKNIFCNTPQDTYRHFFVKQVEIMDVYNNLIENIYTKNYVLTWTDSIDPILVNGKIDENLDFKKLTYVITIVQDNKLLNTSILVN